MLEGLEFAVVALFTGGTFGFTSNALILLGMYYGRKVILMIVRDHLTS